MKRRELLRRIDRIAKSKGVTATYTEGRRHTKVELNGRRTTIPRHREINELTALGILDYLEGE